MSILTAGRSPLGAFIRSPLYARTEDASAPFGEVYVEFLLAGTRYRVCDKQRLYAQCYYFADVTPQSWVLRYTLSDDVDRKWKTQAELDSGSMYTLAGLQLYTSTTVVPTKTITRVSDKIVECDVTPQVDGKHAFVNPDAVILPLNSKNYIVKMNGDAITTAEQPRKGDFVLGIDGNAHFAQASRNLSSGVSLLADVNGEYEQLVEGTLTAVATGYAQNDPVGIQYEVPMTADTARFTDLLVDFGAGAASLAGEEVALVFDTDSYTGLGRTTDSIAEFTDVDGTDESMVAGLVASASEQGALNGLQLGDASIIDEDDAVRLRFGSGFTPLNAREINDASSNIAVETEPERPNPYASPYDSDIEYGWVWSGTNALTVRDHEGTVIATISDLESIIPAWDAQGDFVQVGSSPDVYAALFSSGGLAGLSNIVFRVFDDTLITTDPLFVDVARADVEV